jgi:hypothetical protein
MIIERDGAAIFNHAVQQVYHEFKYTRVHFHLIQFLPFKMT